MGAPIIFNAKKISQMVCEKQIIEHLCIMNYSGTSCNLITNITCYCASQPAGVPCEF